MDLAPLILLVINSLVSLGLQLTHAINRLYVLRDRFIGFIYKVIAYVFPHRQFRLPKIPEHLALLITDKKISDNDRMIADVAWYCVLYGIPQLTVYDPWSIVSNKLNDGFVDKLVDVFEAKALDDDSHLSVRVQVNGVPVKVLGESSTGTVSSLSIVVLDSTDGRQRLADLSQQFADSGRAVDELTSSWISASLTNNRKSVNDVCPSSCDRTRLLSEPDCLLRAGSTPCWMGYPPWNIRLTEFMQLPSGSYEDGYSPLSEYIFVECLDSFGRRQQRCGK